MNWAEYNSRIFYVLTFPELFQYRICRISLHTITQISCVHAVLRVLILFFNLTNQRMYCTVKKSRMKLQNVWKILKYICKNNISQFLQLPSLSPNTCFPKSNNIEMNKVGLNICKVRFNSVSICYLLRRTKSRTC
jgi:hypothetical protein